MTCFIDFFAASPGVSSSSFIIRLTFSTTTIASSTTSPIARTRASKVIIFILNPTARRNAKVPINEITSCGVGYRAKFIKEAAKIIDKKEIDFDYLKKCDYQDAKENICQIPGVGNKVADCVLLFSLDKLEAVPLDRWIIRILGKYYAKKFEMKTKTITEKQYDILHKKIVDHFGPFAGYSQQFLFKMEREIYQKKWL